MIVKVKVVTRAKRGRIEEFDQGLKICLTAPALEGKANKQLIVMLAKYYHTKSYNIKVIKGEKQKNKIVEVLTPRSWHSHKAY